MQFPQFKYHPDPLRTGSIVRSADECEVCGKPRGFLYEGGIYTEEEIEKVCPWCIADGSAHEKFDIEFVDMSAVGGDDWDEVASEIAEEVAFRTPGFSSWQGERWFTHCGDAAEFLGTMGKKELQQAGEEAVEAIRLESGYDEGEWQDYFNSMHANRGPATAYLFKCRHCGKLGGYSDCN